MNIEPGTRAQIESYLLCTEQVQRSDGVTVQAGRHTRREIQDAVGLHAREVSLVREDLSQTRNLPEYVIQYRGRSLPAFACPGCGIKVYPKENRTICAARKFVTDGGPTFTPRDRSQNVRPVRDAVRRAEQEAVLAALASHTDTGGTVAPFRSAKKVDPLVRLHQAIADATRQVTMALEDLEGYNDDSLLFEYIGRGGTGIPRTERVPVAQRLSGPQGKIAALEKLLHHTGQEIAVKGRMKREEVQRARTN